MMIEIKEIPKEKTEFFEKEWKDFDEEIGIRWKKEKAVFGAFQNRKLIGYATLDVTGGVGYVRKLLVAKAFRGQGIGEALIKRVEDDCRKRGCHKLTLKTTERHKTALELYKRLGYRTEAMLENDKFKLAWHLMSKRLS